MRSSTSNALARVRVAHSAREANASTPRRARGTRSRRARATRANAATALALGDVGVECARVQQKLVDEGVLRRAGVSGCVRRRAKRKSE